MKNKGHRLEEWFIQSFMDKLEKAPFGCPIQRILKTKEEHDKLSSFDMMVTMRDGLQLHIDVTMKHPEEKRCIKVFKSGMFGWKVKHYLNTTTKSLVVRIGQLGVSPQGLIEWLSKRYNEGKLIPPI